MEVLRFRIDRRPWLRFMLLAVWCFSSRTAWEDTQEVSDLSFKRQVEGLYCLLLELCTFFWVKFSGRFRCARCTAKFGGLKSGLRFLAAVKS